MTRFTVDPVGSDSRLRIETNWEPSPGFAGLIERLLAPRLFRKLYADELALIVSWAAERESPPRHDR